MLAGELKRILEDVPDDYPILLRGEIFNSRRNRNKFIIVDEIYKDSNEFGDYLAVHVSKLNNSSISEEEYIDEDY